MPCVLLRFLADLLLSTPMLETIYCGERIEGSATVWKTTVRDGQEVARQELSPRNDLRNHSPTGFEWSYGGSGPAQLALALLADALPNEETALGLYQSFKWEVVVALPWRAWSLTESEVRQVAAKVAALRTSDVSGEREHGQSRA